MEFQNGDWVEVNPQVENPEGNVYTVEHNLELTPGEYEAILVSENTYGWSEPSIPHMFNYSEYPRSKLLHWCYCFFYLLSHLSVSSINIFHLLRAH
jgi:hypothetical protein